eukprot:12121085-Prorocentrum_lima.AAC.1
MASGLQQFQRSEDGMTLWWQGWFGHEEKDACLKACDTASPSEKRWARATAHLQGDGALRFLTATQ